MAWSLADAASNLAGCFAHLRRLQLDLLELAPQAWVTPTPFTLFAGLDSTSAMHLLQLLRKLSLSGRAIVTTIHQPSSRLFQQLDKLLLLSKVCADFCCVDVCCSGCIAVSWICCLLAIVTVLKTKATG